MNTSELNNLVQDKPSNHVSQDNNTVQFKRRITLMNSIGIVIGTIIGESNTKESKTFP